MTASIGDCNASVGENIYNWKTCHAFLKADPESKKLFSNYIISHMNQD